jgi:hypothetical protein
MFSVGSELLKAVIVFWDVTPFSSIDVHRRFGGTYCLYQSRTVSQGSSGQQPKTEHDVLFLDWNKGIHY